MSGTDIAKAVRQLRRTERTARNLMQIDDDDFDRGYYTGMAHGVARAIGLLVNGKQAVASGRARPTARTADAKPAPRRRSK